MANDISDFKSTPSSRVLIPIPSTSSGLFHPNRTPTMASQKYAVGRPHIEEWLEGFESLADVTGDDLNELFVDKLGWKQDADEAKNKRNLIAWIRKHFPDKDVERLAVTNLVKTSMTTSRPASVAKTTVSPPAAPATRAAQPATSSSLPPPPRRNAVTTGGTDTADGGSDVAASSKPNKTPSPPKLINPVFPKVGFAPSH